MPNRPVNATAASAQMFQANPESNRTARHNIPVRGEGLAPAQADFEAWAWVYEKEDWKQVKGKVVNNLDGTITVLFPGYSRVWEPIVKEVTHGSDRD